MKRKTSVRGGLVRQIELTLWLCGSDPSRESEQCNRQSHFAKTFDNIWLRFGSQSGVQPPQPSDHPCSTSQTAGRSSGRSTSCRLYRGYLHPLSQRDDKVALSTIRRRASTNRRPAG